MKKYLVIADILLLCGVMLTSANGVVTNNMQLVAYYDFEDYQDNSVMLDVTDNDYDLVPKRGQFYYTGGGPVGNAGQFIGSDYGAAMGSFDDMTMFRNASNWSITLWFKGLGTADLQYRGLTSILTPDQSTVRFIASSRSDSNAAYAYIYDANDNLSELFISNFIGIGEWNFLAVTYKNGTFTIYGNTEGEDDLISYSTGLSNPELAYVTGMNFYLGTRLGSHFNGLMDEVGVFNEALGASQVEQIFDAGKNATRLDEVIDDIIPNTFLTGDLNKDLYVNFEDIALFVQEWLYCSDPLDSSCDIFWK